jgi:hypothetical protein
MPQSSAVPECRHILTSGRKCHAIALRGRPFCYQHSHQRTLAADRSYKFVKLPPFEDHASILLALNQVTRAMTSGRINDKVAGRCLYAIQLAMQTIRHLESQPPIEQVTDYLPGRFGDTVAVNDQPRTAEDLHYLLSEHERSHSSHGDNGWEPTNADYEPESPKKESPEPESDDLKGKQRETEAAFEPVSTPIDPPERSDTHPATKPPAPSPTEPNANPADKPAPRPQKPDAADPNSSEVPEGRPKPALAAVGARHLHRNSA